MSRRRARGKVTPAHQAVIEDFVSSLVADGLSPVTARSYGEHVREFHRETGINFLALTPEDLVGFMAACDRKLEELDREEAEDLARDSPGEH